MDSVDKLREESLKFAPNVRRDVNMALNEIEAELAERYQLLPVDADGVPVRVGEKMVHGCTGHHVGEVVGVGDGVFFTRHYMTDYHRYFASDSIHKHVPTVENVLRDFSVRVINSGHQWGLDEPDTIAEFAEKIREVLRDE